jgi:hypothetical protein
MTVGRIDHADDHAIPRTIGIVVGLAFQAAGQFIAPTQTFMLAHVSFPA